MSALVIDYKELATISSHANDLAKKADAYADSLTRKIRNKFDSVAGGVNGTLSSAKYYVNAKINELQAKKAAYENFAKGVTSLITNAKRIDKEVANAISNNKDKFLKSNPHLKIDDWKANLINWLVDLKNSCPLFELIGDGLANIGTAITSALDNIKYWYKCEGGKEILAFVAAIGGAIIAVALFVATLPASGFFAICAAIGAAITAINALTNVATSFTSMISAKSGDPAWAKIYGDENKFTDWLRNTNFNNGLVNRLSYGAASLIDGVELFCDVVNIVNLVKKFKFKFDFLQNFFDKNTGLLSYMKTAKWTDALQYDEFGNITGVTKVMKVNEYGVVETRYTLKSVFNGLKAYVMNKPIDTHTEKGIRTLLNQNFKTDFKMFIKSTFSVTAWKDTFKYNVTDGGRISFTEWKNSFSLTAMKDTIKYNMKYSSLKGMFSDGVAWKKRKDFIKTTANGFKSIIGVSQKIESIVVGEYSISEDIKGKLEEKKTGFSDLTTIKGKIEKLVTKTQGTYKNTYIYKSANATN